MRDQKSNQGKHHPKMGKPRLKVVFSDDAKSPNLPPSERDYFTQLHRIIDKIYEMAANDFKWTWAQLATHSNLSYPTVCNLGDRQTKFPRYQTVHKLAHAVGMKLTLQAVPQHRTAAPKMAALG